MTKLFKKNWIFDLICAILGTALAVVLFIPSIGTKIVSIVVGVLLIIFFITIICPKFAKIRSFGTEWVIWFLIEAFVVLALGILAIVNQQMQINLLIITLKLSHIIGLVICLEGVVGLIKLINYNPSSNAKKTRRSAKYTYILAVIIGTFVFTNVNISDKDLAVFLAIIVIGFVILALVLMFTNLPAKKEKKAKKESPKQIETKEGK